MLRGVHLFQLLLSISNRISNVLTESYEKGTNALGRSRWDRSSVFVQLKSMTCLSHYRLDIGGGCPLALTVFEQLKSNGTILLNHRLKLRWLPMSSVSTLGGCHICMGGTEVWGTETSPS